MAALEFKRKKHRLDRIEYVGEKWFFITMCCEHRRKIFLIKDKVGWVIEFLRIESNKNQFVIDTFCVMPDHLHFLALGTAPISNLFVFAKSFK